MSQQEAAAAADAAANALRGLRRAGRRSIDLLNRQICADTTTFRLYLTESWVFLQAENFHKVVQVKLAHRCWNHEPPPLVVSRPWYAYPYVEFLDHDGNSRHGGMNHSGWFETRSRRWGGRYRTWYRRSWNEGNLSQNNLDDAAQTRRNGSWSSNTLALHTDSGKMNVE